MKPPLCAPRDRRGCVRVLSLYVALCLCVSVSWVRAAGEQELIDHVVVRVDGNALTLSDVRAAMGLGIVSGPAGAAAAGAAPAGLQSAVEFLVQRYLLLAEVQRFPPAEPAPAAIDAEVAELKAHVGDGLAALLRATGLDESRLREIARENVRIQAYLDQRFGTSVQVTDEEVEQYYRTRPDEFTRAGSLLPFNDVSTLARQRASALRRQATIDQWMRDLRQRADVVLRSTP
ncbi:MAG: hypothetical protein ABL993_13160 [Vicinamibacterales bacterium]